MQNKIVIENRYCGPPDSGHGGYTCGRLANFIHGVAEVTLRRPPPLNKELRVKIQKDGKAVLYDANGDIAEATSAALDLKVPLPPTFSAAQSSATKIEELTEHYFPTCFTCGPHRKENDGLRIFPGQVEGKNYVAAPWIPDSSLCDDAGKVKNEVIWAALDCPSGWAIILEQMRFMLLGRLIVQVKGRMKAGEKCIVMGWEISSEGRKLYAGSAVFSENGQLYAKAKATWIELKSTG